MICCNLLFITKAQPSPPALQCRPYRQSAIFFFLPFNLPVPAFRKRGFLFPYFSLRPLRSLRRSPRRLASRSGVPFRYFPKKAAGDENCVVNTCLSCNNNTADNYQQAAYDYFYYSGQIRYLTQNHYPQYHSYQRITVENRHKPGNVAARVNRQ